MLSHFENREREKKCQTKNQGFFFRLGLRVCAFVVNKRAYTHFGWTNDVKKGRNVQHDSGSRNAVGVNIVFRGGFKLDVNKICPHFTANYQHSSYTYKFISIHAIFSIVFLANFIHFITQPLITVGQL